MNLREMRLLVVLGVIVVVGGGAILGWNWFYKPLRDSIASIKKLEGEIEQKRDLLDATLAERKRLELARLMSLSPNPELAISEYGNMLHPLLQQYLEVDTFRPAPTVDMKGPAGGPGAGAAAALKPGHQIVSFQVRVKGNLDGLVKVLAVMQLTPLVHRIKTLDIARVDSTAKSKTDKLTISMIVEAMIVSKAPTHFDGPLAPDPRLMGIETLLASRRGPTGIAMLPWVVGPTGPFARQRLAMESGFKRQYLDVARKNIFTGALPPPASFEDIFKEPPADYDMREFVRLDTTDPDSKEAFFRNLIIKTRAKRVRASPGYDVFQIDSEYKTHVLLRLKVLRVDQRDLYFQVAESVYKIHIGESIAHALSRAPLRDEVTALLGLDDLYDPAFAEREAKEASKSSSKTKKKGGR